ncbi:MAG: hypothetical protein GKR95_19255 [Gammaproteobacteria bacterium]|nr:hypothetical protein [Gammaproteobacteria bacterium]
MKLLKFFLILATTVIVGCNGTNTSSSSGSGGSTDLAYSKDVTVRITTGAYEGGHIYVWYHGSGTSSDPLVVKVNIRDANNNPLPGTIHWQDNTDDRVFNGTMLPHVYESNGNYQIAIEPDGGEKVTTFTEGTTITVSESSEEVEEDICLTATFSIFC